MSKTNTARSFDAEVQMVPVKRLTFDLRVQRAGGTLPSRLRHLKARWDFDMVGILTASARADGKLVCLDGMHRATVMTDNGFGDWKVPVNIYTGLTLAQEASIFRSLNDGAKASPFDDYVTGVVAEDPECSAIDRILTARGLSAVNNTNADGTIRAVNALRTVYRGAVGRTSRPGAAHPELLGSVLDVATKAWGSAYTSYDGQVLQGLGIAIRHGGEAMDLSSLVRKLSTFKGGAAGVLSRGRSLKELGGGTVAKCIATLALAEYNRGKRNGQLPPL